jgi:hypothetical protein
MSNKALLVDYRIVIAAMRECMYGMVWYGMVWYGMVCYAVVIVMRSAVCDYAV